MKLYLLLLTILISSFVWADSISYENNVLNDNPVGYWKLDEGNGTNANDASGQGHTGVYHNVAFSNSGPFADSNSSIQISSSNSSYVNISEAGNTSLDVSYITMEAWINPAQYSVSHDRGMVINKEDCWEFGLEDNSGKVQSALYTSSWAWRGNHSVSLNSWSHVVITFDGNRVRHYVNGNLVDWYDYSGTLAQRDTDLKIGARGGDSVGSSYFEGGIAQVAIYDYALSGTQIQNHYTAASGITTGTIPELNTLTFLLCIFGFAGIFKRFCSK